MKLKTIEQRFEELFRELDRHPHNMTRDILNKVLSNLEKRICDDYFPDSVNGIYLEN